MDGPTRGSRIRSFAIGGIVGAAGAIAAVRRPPRRVHDAPGLAAFEDAPCFLEIVDAEAQRHREGGEISTDPPNPT